jgi:hypothetical protein
MTKIVINKRIGGFGLSYFGLTEYTKRKGLTLYPYKLGAIKSLVKIDNSLEYKNNYGYYIAYFTKDFGEIINLRSRCLDEDIRNHAFIIEDIPRGDPILIKIIEEFGSDKISSTYSLLKIVEIPDNIEWNLEESEEGIEWISEKHRIWS